jgi:hypothetical protein
VINNEECEERNNLEDEEVILALSTMKKDNK